MAECSDCPKTLDPRNKTGRCRNCYFKHTAADPAAIAVRAAGLRRRLASPEGAHLRNRLGNSQKARLDWCPIEYRDEYRALIRSHLRYRAKDARRIIEEQIAVDTRRYLETGLLQRSTRSTAS